MKLKFIYIIFIFSSLIIIVFSNIHFVNAAGTWFVSPTGNDANICNDPSFPCATLQATIGKATADDMIKVAVGSYTSNDKQVLLVNKNIVLSGGWDYSFQTQVGDSIIDGEDDRYDVWILENVIVTIEHFILQNGTWGVINSGSLIGSYLDVSNNNGPNYCWSSGITNYGTMVLEWSSIHDNDCSCGGYGGWIYNAQYSGSLTILNSTIYNNHAYVGGGIYNADQLIIINSTISNNIVSSGFSNSSGGGIYNSSAYVDLSNSTITNNEGGPYGGGIYFFNTYGGYVTLRNTILANNTADKAPDCWGSIGSAGYNLISDTSSCAFTGTTGDQLNIDPLLGPLQNNGGPTLTRWLYADSTALDGGNPEGCKDSYGNPLTIDQRSLPRPLDGNSDGNNVCDMGAYEADPNNLPPPPLKSRWYVTKNGDDSNVCHTHSNSCLTINGALAKATSGDTIYVSAENYSSIIGNQVVLIDKNITLLGGWNADFTVQDGMTVIDGETKRRGITINEQLTVTIKKFIIQNGYIPVADQLSTGGGGISINYRSKVTIDDSIIQGNHMGGIYIDDAGSLTINFSQVINNTIITEGGGIHSGSSTLIVSNSVVENNTAGEGGGIYGGINGQVEIINSNIISNISTFVSSGGGGIRSDNILSVKNSIIANNIAEHEEGGGVQGVIMTIENTSIFNNQAAGSGGGIFSYYSLEIHNCAIINNVSNSHGGGIYSGGDLVITNSTIAYNKAIRTGSFESSGGGIYRAGGFIQASNVTIVRNSATDYAGGIHNHSAPVTLRNTILAENQAAAGPNCDGIIISAGHNLSDNTMGCDFAPTYGDMLNKDARLSLLYGWPTTVALWMDSPAIDAGRAAGCIDEIGNTITSDQIGTIRPLDGNGDHIAICDIGAYEYDPENQPKLLFFPLVARQ